MKKPSFLFKIYFLLHNRFVVFGLFLTGFVLTQYFGYDTFLPSTETKDLWFYTGVFMVLFSILFIEPYFTSPKNVVTNTIPLLLVFLSIKVGFINQVFWWFAVVVLLTLTVVSIVAMALEDKDNSPNHWKNRVSNGIKSFVVVIGQGKVLYSSVFIYFLLTYYSIQDFYTLALFVLWFFILCIDPKSIHSKFLSGAKQKTDDQIGEIFGVQSKKIFLVKMFGDRKSIKKFDIVKFRYYMQDAGDLAITGIVFDTYLLNQEKWAKILQLGDVKKEESKLEKNIVYKISDEDECKRIVDELRVDKFVGVVIDGSSIGKIKFEYSKKKDDLQEGDLLELRIDMKRLFYQVVAGVTEKERLEARNETGFIEGEAIQLGEWQGDKLSFQKFGWVPAINTPLFRADTSDIPYPDFAYPKFKLGVIPRTSLPSVLDLGEAVSHHIALLGVTGSGKSHLANKMIQEILQDTKVVCIDFTGEWKKRFPAAKFTMIGKDSVEAHLGGTDQKLGIFELSTLSNISGTLNETQGLIEKVFHFAKQKYDAGTPVKIALVLEEAHTITPETGFLANNSFEDKALVNKMSQIALQGRKYGVGLMIIGQRTANVSKTVLTQCNTVVCFQAFDETSFSFLGNYVGKDMVQALPNLPQFHAVVAGKAAKSNMPMIVDLT